MPETKPLSVIIVHYGSDEPLRACLSSLAMTGSLHASEVIIVNNTPTSLSRLAQVYPFFEEIFVGENIGFGAAANRGARRATGEILFFLNPDTHILIGDTLDHMIHAARHKANGVTGIALLSGHLAPEKWSYGYQTSLARVLGNHLGTFPWRNPERVGWVSGGALCLLKKHFSSLGGFDENFFLYFEDMDLCLRAAQKGIPVSYDTSKKILHRGGMSFTDRLTQKKLYYTSQMIYFRKHRPIWEQAMLSWLHTARLFFSKALYARTKKSLRDNKLQEWSLRRPPRRR